MKNARNGRYLENGYLTYYNQGSLIAVPMSLNRLQITGSPVSLLSAVAQFFGCAAFDLSKSGTLVYVRGRTEPKRVVSWLDSSGRREPLLATPDRYLTPKLSPDGKRLALTIEKGDGANVWVYDIGRGTMTPMPAGGEYQFHAVWTPDGEYLVFQSDGKLAWTRSDGSGRVEHLSGTRQAFPTSFSGDGARLFFYQTTGGRYDLWDVSVQKGGSLLGNPRRLTEGPGSEAIPAVSPSGKWLAYTTLIDPVQSQVVVVALAPNGTIGTRKWQISNRPGSDPVWAKDGHALFYKAADGRIMVVPYSEAGSVFIPGKPSVWSEERLSTGTGHLVYDLAPDGKRAVAVWDVGDPDKNPPKHLHVVLNFASQL